MKIQLIDEWKSFYKMYSIWAIAILGSLGDIYNLAVSYHMLDASAAPALLTHSLNIVGFIGAVSRLVKQKEANLADGQGGSDAPVIDPPAAPPAA